ncbi:MAG: D-alanine--D-alanine ligase [Myxococcales bacterium]|nr:D-alanine--D-alanine ligase [Myxococcales bacterium]MBL0193624.1 D-alanine--D-alanine ligase [Myxococcales bacterium]HQY63251.1 D-alanine--D-alanine ligase [Polyangiaceae bacterium]
MTKVHGRVGVLMGGASAEREVSLRTGEGVAAALESRGHEVVRVVLDRPERFAESVARANLDVAFLGLHGRYGEDGCVQGLLELLGVPYTGSSVLASALAMDKVKAKELFRLHNVPTPPYFVATAETLVGLASQHENFGFPVVVKPRSEGSSVGLAVAKDLAGLEAGIEAALDHDGAALVERFVRGTEVHVALLGGRVLGAIEVVPKSGLYDYEAKYTPGATDYICPPRLPTTRLRGVMNLAERAASALGCTGACRVDLLVTEGENEYVLEVNTLPGMTPTSLLPKIAASAGIDYATLCETILEQATLHGASRRTPASTRRVAVDTAASGARVSVRRAG